MRPRLPCKCTPTVRKCTGTTEPDKTTCSHPVSLTSAVASTDTTWLGIGTLPHEPALPLSRRASGTAPRGRCPILQRWRPRSARLSHSRRIPRCGRLCIHSRPLAGSTSRGHVRREAASQMTSEARSLDVPSGSFGKTRGTPSCALGPRPPRPRWWLPDRGRPRRRHSRGALPPPPPTAAAGLVSLRLRRPPHSPRALRLPTVGGAPTRPAPAVVPAHC